MQDPISVPQSENTDAGEHADAPAVPLGLTGDLPCVGCGYNLRGLSVKGDCPECGLRVGATVLAIVDPYASELEPLRAPARTGRLLVLWVSGALLAAVAMWTTHAAELLSEGASRFKEVADALRPLGPAGMVISMFGAGAFVRPCREMPARSTALAVVGVLLYIPLIFVHIRIHWGFDAVQGLAYFRESGPPFDRTVLRLLWAALLTASLLCLRPTARSFARRSKLFRSGQVDRQTMLVTVAVIGIGAVGDVMQLLATVVEGVAADVFRLGGVMLVGTGSALLTIALVNIATDIRRLWPVVARHPISPADVLERRARLDRPEP